MLQVQARELNHLFYIISQSALWRITPSVFAISFDSEPTSTLRVRLHVTGKLQKGEEEVLADFARDLRERCPERDVTVETVQIPMDVRKNQLDQLEWMVFRRHISTFFYGES
jgi:hypothetical protein